MVSIRQLLAVAAGVVAAMSYLNDKEVSQAYEIHQSSDIKQDHTKQFKEPLDHAVESARVRRHHRWSGQHGYVTLINATPYDWNLTCLHPNNIDYDFPALVPAGTVHEQYVNFRKNHGLGTAKATYNLINAPRTASFSVQARHASTKHIYIQYQDDLSSVNNPPRSKIDLGFEDGGAMLFILSGSGPSFTSSNPPTAWMQNSLSSIGSKSLREFCMPASHDSGMYTLTHKYAGIKHNTLTQSHGIYEQAKYGARYFDIRPVIRKGEFYVGHLSKAVPVLRPITHYVGGTGAAMHDIVRDVNRFNKDFPGELLILDMSHDMNTDHDFRHFTEPEWQDLYGLLDGIVNLWAPETLFPRDLSTVPLSTFITPGSRSATIIRLPYHAPLPTPKEQVHNHRVKTERGGNSSSDGDGDGNRSSDGNDNGTGDMKRHHRIPKPKSLPHDHTKEISGSHIVSPIVQRGAFVPDMWMPVVNRYSDTEHPDRMSADQISKMLEHKPTEDGALMGVWTLTQTWQHGVDFGNPKHSIVGEAVQAHRRLFGDLWPVMSMENHPNLVQVDDIRSKDVLALTMAINDNFVGPSQFSRRDVPLVAPEPVQTPCSAFDHVAHWFGLYPKAKCFNPRPFQNFAKNAQELAEKWENDKLANEHARANDTAAMQRDEEAWTSRRVASLSKLMEDTMSEVTTTRLDLSTTRTTESTVTDPPKTDDDLDGLIASTVAYTTFWA